MDWISHLLFGLTLGAILLRDRFREKIVFLAATSLLPDLDILWYHRSELHSPLILLVFALLPAIHNRALFFPLLTGFWSHSALDIFLFDNSNHTIKNLADQVIANESIAQSIEENVTGYIAADGIMLLYPFSNEKFSITLGEKSYAIMASIIIVIAIFTFSWMHFKQYLRKFQ